MRIVSTLSTVGLDRSLHLFLLYIGPDLMMPIVSAFAAIVGVLLMFWQRVVGLFRSMFGLFRRDDKPRA